MRSILAGNSCGPWADEPPTSQMNAHYLVVNSPSQCSSCTVSHACVAALRQRRVSQVVALLLHVGPLFLRSFQRVPSPSNTVVISLSDSLVVRTALAGIVALVNFPPTQKGRKLVGGSRKRDSNTLYRFANLQGPL